MTNSKRKQHCNKVKHRSLLAAQIVLKKTITRAAKKGNNIVSKISAYKCEFCDGWHVGTSKREINWDEVAKVDERLKKLRSENAGMTRTAS